MESNPFNLRAFIESYVNSAFESLRVNELKPLSDFEKIMWASVSKELDISIESIKYLHHPFHWAFFCTNDKSPFEYIQSHLFEEVTSVRLKLNSNEVRKEMIAYVTENDYTLLEAKLKRARENKLVNISHQ